MAVFRGLCFELWVVVSNTRFVPSNDIKQKLLPFPVVSVQKFFSIPLSLFLLPPGEQLWDPFCTNSSKSHYFNNTMINLCKTDSRLLSQLSLGNVPIIKNFCFDLFLQMDLFCTNSSKSQYFNNTMINLCKTDSRLLSQLSLGNVPIIKNFCFDLFLQISWPPHFWSPWPPIIE